jgi:hypothetical protein
MLIIIMYFVFKPMQYGGEICPCDPKGKDLLSCPDIKCPQINEAEEIQRLSKYYLGEKCPELWETVGKTGIIVHKSATGRSPFKSVAGGWHNNDWQWNHPMICKGSQLPLPQDKLYKFGLKGNIRVGVISNHTNMVPAEIEIGGKHNDSWTWVHPYLVPADDKENSWTIGNKDVEQGRIGMIAPKNGFETGLGKEFDRGNSYNKDWVWYHPYLQKNETQ